MPLVVVGISVLILLFLMTKVKLNGFAALLLVAVGVAVVQGIPLEKIPDTLSEGIGGQIGDTMLTIGLGAMVGRVMGDSGAAQRIAGRLMEICGPRWVQVAMVLTAMLIGVTMFYEVAFVIIVPVAFTIVRVTRANLLWVGLPMSIALSTMHSFLPPHPGPTSVAATFDASVGRTLFYGLFIAVPVGALIALVWPRLPFVRAMNPALPQGLVSERVFEDDEMPGMGWSLSVALLPVVLIAGAAVTDMATSGSSPFLHFVAFIGSAPIALLLTLLVAVWAFGPPDRPQPERGQHLLPGGRTGDGDDPAGDRRGRGLQTGPRRRRDLRLHQGRHRRLVHLPDHSCLADRGHPPRGPGFGDRRRRHRLRRGAAPARRQRSPP